MVWKLSETHHDNDRAIAKWLLFVAFLVFAMIVVGGATRLTESGLSMVDWQPISGVLPPMSDAEWQQEFTNYQAYPEYQKVNRGMSLDEFKAIFWWEYGHRLLGRFIGIAFALPLLFFLARKKVRSGLKLKLFWLLALGGAQGLMGWYMVKSGLVNDPAVSHYRLAAHLMLALLIFSALSWVALGLLRPDRRIDVGDERLRRLSLMMILLVTLQMFWGALVAGLDAGIGFNTWPSMDGAIIPAGMWDLSPFWVNVLENSVTVQFVHRLGAYLVAILAVMIFLRARRVRIASDIKGTATLLTLAVLAQVGVGIWTLVEIVPVSLGTLHQGLGVVVLGAAVYLAYELRRGHI